MSRTETDSIGPIEVADDVYWGAQTQRSLENFAIGNQQMPLAVVHALATVKKAAARVNLRLRVAGRRRHPDREGQQRDPRRLS